MRNIGCNNKKALADANKQTKNQLKGYGVDHKTNGKTGDIRFRKAE